MRTLFSVEPYAFIEPKALGVDPGAFVAFVWSVDPSLIPLFWSLSKVSLPVMASALARELDRPHPTHQQIKITQ